VIRRSASRCVGPALRRRKIPENSFRHKNISSHHGVKGGNQQ
jgi:hypothetical protein